MTNLGSTHYFVLVFFIGLLDMLVASLDFDMITATSMGPSIVNNIMFKDSLVMIGYKEMLINLALLDL